VENLKLKVKHLNGREHQLKKALAQATGKPKDAISQKPPASHATGPSAQPDSKHNSSSTTTKVTPTSSASFQSGLYPTNIGWISPYDDDVTSRGMNPAPPNSPTSIPPTIHHESGGGRARPEGPLSTLNIQDVLRDQVSHESGYSRNSGYRTGGRWKFGQPSYRG